jgi:molybdopterin-guanine dinucleotide biosynthesis protein A
MSAAHGDITGVLLAGGKSRRMGRDKRFIEIEGRTLLERSLAVLEKLFPEILVAVAGPDPELEGLRHRVVTDLIPGCATLGGLYTGLFYAANPRIFAVACDMPFVNENAILRVIELGKEADVAMVKLSTGIQPMHALYAKSCLGPMRKLIEAGNLKVQLLAESQELDVRVLQEGEFRANDELLSFLNVNTPADLELVRKLLVRPAGKQPRKI